MIKETDASWVQFLLKITPELSERLDKIAAYSGVSKTAMIRLAISWFLDNQQEIINAGRKKVTAKKRRK
jgi:predicted transcriptional regulator